MKIVRPCIRVNVPTRPPEVAPADRLRVAPGSPLCSDTCAPLRRSSGTTSGYIPPRAIRRAAPSIMAASFCFPRVTADGGGRYAPPPTPRAGGKRGGSGITREGRRLRGNDNAARIANVDAPPTLWPLNNGAAFRAVLLRRTAPDVPANVHQLPRRGAGDVRHASRRTAKTAPPCSLCRAVHRPRPLSPLA